QRLSVVHSNGTLNFTGGWQSTPDPTTNVSEISNDTVNYKSLMIAGNKSAGGGRRVTIYDNLSISTPTAEQNLSVYYGANIDQGNANNGTLPGGGNTSLTFGSGSGEGIGSQRTAGTGQYGLDFYTGFLKRVSISQVGWVGIGTNAPAFPL